MTILNSNIILNGHNSLSSREIYNNRILYNQNVTITDSINTWQDKNLYGRINHNGATIFANEVNLKAINSNLFALDFIADAFHDFANYYNQLKTQRKISSDSIINIESKNGWTSLHQLYQIHQNLLYNIYITYLISSQRDKKIANFNNFVEQFLLFVSTISDIPITRSQFISSNHCSSLISGMIIEIGSQNYSSDIIKQQYISDRNFEMYRKIAKRYGFVIDINVPNRLIYNINSKIATKYMSRYGINYQSIFSKYFYSAQSHDVEILQSYLKQFYTSFITAHPKFVNCRNQQIERDKNFGLDIINELRWLHIYGTIKLAENKKLYDIRMIKDVVKIYHVFGKDEVIKYINQNV